MNPMMLPVGGLLTGRIDWPFDGSMMALGLVTLLLLLVGALVRETRVPEAKSRTSIVPAPRLSRVHGQQAA